MANPTDELFGALERADRLALAAGVIAALVTVAVVLFVGSGFSRRSGRPRQSAVWILLAALVGLMAYAVSFAYVSNSLHINAIIAFAKAKGCSRATAQQVAHARDVTRLSSSDFERLTLFLVPQPTAYRAWLAVAAAPASVACGLVAGVAIRRSRSRARDDSGAAA